ncbi:MAG: hypothetical protein ACT4QB_15870 [Gammaproteobacteria bacterium]
MCTPSANPAYLITIAHGLIVNHRRRSAIGRAYWEALTARPEGLAPSPEAHALIVETLVEIDALLDRLPAKVRGAFLMAQLDGPPYDDYEWEGVDPPLRLESMS